MQLQTDRHRFYTAKHAS